MTDGGKALVLGLGFLGFLAALKDNQAIVAQVPGTPGAEGPPGATGAGFNADQTADTDTTGSAATVDVPALAIGQTQAQVDVWVTGRITSAGAAPGEIRSYRVLLSVSAQNAGPYARVAGATVLIDGGDAVAQAATVAYAINAPAGPAGIKRVRLTLTGLAGNPMAWLVRSSTAARS